jgi:hypothetical protein
MQTACQFGKTAENQEFWPKRREHKMAKRKNFRQFAGAAGGTLSALPGSAG